ncbi:MAG: hypothetical protein M3Z04_00140, partial [Chloroflexota bacterium]|nr:hypothetical protein [Chloroflexota bacterium]
MSRRCQLATDRPRMGVRTGHEWGHEYTNGSGPGAGTSVGGGSTRRRVRGGSTRRRVRGGAAGPTPILSPHHPPIRVFVAPFVAGPHPLDAPPALCDTAARRSPTPSTAHGSRPTAHRPPPTAHGDPPMPPSLTLPQFVAQWRNSPLTEKSGAQSHFIQLCGVLGVDAPGAGDQPGAAYTFEQGLTKTTGKAGWADVWKQGFFAWEYKGPKGDLDAAYNQLLQYRDALESPPLLVVSTFREFRVATNFTNTAKRTYAFDLNDLLTNKATTTCALPPLDVLHALFTNPEALHPQQTTAAVTLQAATQFAALAKRLYTAGVAPADAAHFLMRLLFCLFAEDVGLLPAGLFTGIVEKSFMYSRGLLNRMRQLFAAMATGGDFGADAIRHFNGGLFDDDTAYELDLDMMQILKDATTLDWSSVEPAIFGTLFERSLDPRSRTKLGAHYTSRDDIALIVEPVLLAPLRREWAAIESAALLAPPAGQADPAGAQAALGAR